MSAITKKRKKSPAKAKNLDVNTLLLQRRSKLCNTANDESIYLPFINKPCQKNDKWFSLIAKKNATSTVWKFYHVVNEIKPGGKSQLGKKFKPWRQKSWAVATYVATY